MNPIQQNTTLSQTAIPLLSAIAVEKRGFQGGSLKTPSLETPFFTVHIPNPGGEKTAENDGQIPRQNMYFYEKMRGRLLRSVGHKTLF